MTWFTATSVTVNNGQTVVSVNAGDDIQLAQESGGLIIGNNPPVEIKRSYLDGSNNKKIELRSAWPYANQAAQPAVAFPTDGDLAAATAVLKQLIDGFALATQAQAEQGTNNTAAMTALRVKQAIDFFRPLTTSTNDTTAGRVWRTNDLVKTTSATDSTAGRMLKVGDGGLLANVSIESGVDVNNFNFTRFQGVNGGVNTPTTNISILAHYQYSSDWRVQEFKVPLAIPQDYIRGRYNGTTWSPWFKKYHEGNILGTVSQAAGVPTGAIIQRGSNANGEFVRLADGTMICTRQGSTSSGGATQFDFEAGFPATFVSNNHLSVNANTNAATPSFQYKVSANTTVVTSATLRFNKIIGSAATENVTWNLTASGRWY